MDSITFLVQGSEVEPYKVVFTKQVNGLTVTCSCQAAHNGLSCKHRLRILNGDKKDIIGNNTDAITMVLMWLKGSEIETALKVVLEAELKNEQAKKELERAKKSLAKTLVLQK